ncbi:hypothetical protein SUGI_0247900 [Cryptomeria japonica]|nr:hypothetical protein SUGI_0247900 [Cryptomeria japonica]
MLVSSPLSYAVELIIRARTSINSEYVRSTIDMMEVKGHPHFTAVESWLISNLTKIRLRDVDFGWGKAVYGGTAMGGVRAIPGIITCLVPYQNSHGAEGKLIHVCLPSHAMQKFQLQFAQAMEKEAPPFIRSLI